MKKFLLLCACVLALAAPLRAQTGPAGIVVVRIFESSTTGSATAVIMHEGGKSETVKFEKGHSEKELTKTSEVYYRMFESLYQEGYHLQSTFGTAEGYTTLLFTKAH
ncbi:hypothetical protein [Hymenobacter cheonanensis]|uniref:hypothetical protein n=1 Tax=Hymenobacter sp. CA2-7 TaxID=3063993 RepID=UPI002713050D|nr:hypothetical protein [Hymenobacter sp. CA2-7]MDO7887648.1 hypothetical protein [Hymenobacter sp. CA2-7]